MDAYHQRLHFERDILPTVTLLSGNQYIIMDFVHRKIPERPVTEHEKISGFSNLASIMFIKTGVPYTKERDN